MPRLSVSQRFCSLIYCNVSFRQLGNTGAVAIVDSRGNVRVEQFY
jgi:hypothetical protein